MKLFFAKTDSIYKIMKILEKIPPYKQAEIFIDPEHAFFDNQWRGRQVQEIISNRKLNIIFNAKNSFNRDYFQQLGLQVQEKKERPIFRILKTFWMFLVDTKRFHLLIQNKQQYLNYLIFSMEIAVGLWLIWFLFVIFMPSANIRIEGAKNNENIIYNFRYYPANEQGLNENIRQLSIPFQTGSLLYQYQLAISTENIHHISNPSEWTVKIFNRTPNELRLFANTRFVASNGAIFVSKDPITIPAGSKDRASELKVKLIAAEFDESWALIGVRGNIVRGTKLTIKNIKDSHMLNTIWAEAMDDFKGGSTTSLGIVSEKDQNILREKLIDSIYKNKLSVVKEQFNKKNSIVIAKADLIKTTFKDIIIEGKVWDKATSLRWTAIVSFDFMYLDWKDLISAFRQYVAERQADSIQLISIDPTSLNLLYDSMKIEDLGKFWIKSKEENSIKTWFNSLFIIPTKISILQGYDFQRDVKGILSQIKDQVTGKTLYEAQKIIQSYPEISSSSIDLWWLWDSTLPSVRSRINIEVAY